MTEIVRSPGNPIAIHREVTFSPKNSDGTYAEESIPAYREVRVWCQGCVQMHPFRVWVSPEFQAQQKRHDGSDWPTWEWNGSLDNPTFSPSLLVHDVVHLCEGEHDYPECPEGSDCDSGHGFAWRLPDGTSRTFKVYEAKPEGAVEYKFCAPSDHPRTPAFGNCHTFLTNGVWQYLDDCAHSLRGNHPLEPIPDWCLPHGF